MTWLPLLFAIPPTILVALVIWATWDLYSQHLADAAKFGLFVVLTVAAPLAWALAAL